MVEENIQNEDSSQRTERWFLKTLAASVIYCVFLSQILIYEVEIFHEIGNQPAVNIQKTVNFVILFISAHVLFPSHDDWLQCGFSHVFMK